MRRPLAAAGIFAALSICLLAGFAARRALVGTGAPAAGPLAPAAPAPAVDDRAVPATAAAPQRIEAPQVLGARLRGRCVAAESGEPLAGCRIVVDGFARGSSDATGHFAVEWPQDASRADVLIEPRGRLAVWRHLAGIGATRELGDVGLRAGAQVDGTVSDTRGLSFGGALVHARSRGPGRDDGWHERWSSQACTADDGSFRFPTGLPAGLLEISVEGVPPIVAGRTFVLESGAQHRLAIVCAATQDADWIRGTVVDEAGTPVPGAVVQALADEPDRRRAVATARTDRDGRFGLCRSEAAAATVRLEVDDSAGGRRSSPSPALRWGAVGVVLQLPAATGLHLFVVDAETGAPIERYVVQCLPTSGMRGTGPTVHRSGGPRGWARLDGIAPGEHALLVLPEDPRWLPALPQPVVHRGDGAPVTIALRRAAPCPVLVLGADGAPIAGAAVELLVPAPGGIVRDLARVFDHGGTRSPVNLRVAQATTDAEGRALLTWCADPEPRELRIHGPGAPCHTERTTRIGQDTVVVRLPAAALLRGRLRGAEGARIVLRNPRGDEWPPKGAAPIDIGGSGSFAADVPAGAWHVHVQRALGSGAGQRVWLTDPAAFATLRLQPGTPADLDADLAAAMALCEVRGSAYVDGAPAPHLALLCGDPAPDGTVAVRHVRDLAADRQGQFRSGALPAGSYALHLRLVCAGRTIAVPVSEWRRAAPGQCLWFEPVAITTTALQLVLRDAAGTAIGEGEVRLRDARGVALLAPADADGTVHFDRVPAGRYRVQLRRGDECHELGITEVVGPRPQAHTFVVRGT